jgi:hypothetical protein
MKNCIIIVFVLCLCGCDRLGTEGVDTKVNTSDVSITGETRIHDGTVSVRQAADLLIEKINVETSNSIKAQKISEFVEMLSKQDISGLSFEEQRSIIREVYDVCIYKEGMVYKIGKFTDSIMSVYDEQAKILSWQLEQIERLRPSRKIDFSALSYNEQQKYSEWRNCYMTAVVEYVQVVRKIERLELPEVKNMVDSIEYKSIIKKLGRALKRKVREDVQEIRSKEKDMEAFGFYEVVKREVGP